MKSIYVSVLIFLMMFTLWGCGGDLGEEFSFNRDIPDEFSVARRRPLTVPPDLYLRPPRGETRSEDLETRGVIDVISGFSVDKREASLDVSEGLSSFLRKLGVFDEVPQDIRTLIEEDRKDRLHEVEESVLEEMVGEEVAN
jgi:hypothetical protein